MTEGSLSLYRRHNYTKYQMVWIRKSVYTEPAHIDDADSMFKVREKNEFYLLHLKLHILHKTKWIKICIMKRVRCISFDQNWSKLFDKIWGVSLNLMDQVPYHIPQSLDKHKDNCKIHKPSAGSSRANSCKMRQRPKLSVLDLCQLLQS